MNSFLLGLFCVIFLSSIITLILPDGRLGKIINFMLSLIVLTFFLSPILNFNFNNSSLNNESKEMLYQESYLTYIKNKNDEQLILNIKNILSEYINIVLKDIEIFSEYDETFNYEVKSICLSFIDDNYNENQKDNLLNEIINLLQNKFNISRELIKVSFL